MATYSAAVEQAIDQLVVANRILGKEGVLDVFGHVSIRHPERADRYFLSCSRSPEQVSAHDIIEFDLNSNPIEPQTRALYSERYIHGSIYQARADVMAVCHNHAHDLLPFTVTNTPMRPACHTAAAIGLNIPNWEIRDDFGDATHLLVVDEARGQSLARKLGAGRVCLMRGHGSVVSSHDLRSTVYVAITLMQNAALLLKAKQLGEVNYLSPAEVRELTPRVLGNLSLDRAWGYWSERAGFKVG